MITLRSRKIIPGLSATENEPDLQICCQETSDGHNTQDVSMLQNNTLFSVQPITKLNCKSLNDKSVHVVKQKKGRKKKTEQSTVTECRRIEQCGSSVRARKVGRPRKKTVQCSLPTTDSLTLPCEQIKKQRGRKTEMGVENGSKVHIYKSSQQQSDSGGNNDIPMVVPSGQIQMKKRGRKPKTERGVVNGKKVPIDKASQHQSESGGNNGIPMVVPCGQVQIKKRGRKPKTGTAVNDTVEKQECGNLVVAQRVESVDETNVKRQKLALSNSTFPQSSSGSSVTSSSMPCWQRQVKKRGRMTETGNVNDREENQECVKPKGKKRGRKPGPPNKKKVTEMENDYKTPKISGVGVGGFYGLRTLHVRVQRLIISNIPKQTTIPSAHLEVGVDKLLPESNCRQQCEEIKTEEMNDGADVACLKMELRSSSKTILFRDMVKGEYIPTNINSPHVPSYSQEILIAFKNVALVSLLKREQLQSVLDVMPMEEAMTVVSRATRTQILLFAHGNINPLRTRKGKQNSSRSDCLFAAQRIEDNAQKYAVTSSSLTSCYQFANCTDTPNTINRRLSMQSSLTDDARNRENKCSTIYGSSHTSNPPNTAVKLHNCRNLHGLLHSDQSSNHHKPDNVFSPFGVKDSDSPKNITYHVNTEASISSSHTVIGNKNNKELVCITNRKSNGKIKRILEDRSDIGNQKRNASACSKGDPVTDSQSLIIASAVEKKNKDIKIKEEDAVSMDTSNSCIDTLEDLIEELNNKCDSTNVNLQDVLCDEKTIENTKQHHSCLPVDQWGTQLPLKVSEDARHDGESLDIECSALIRMPLEDQSAKGYLGCSPQQQYVEEIVHDVYVKGWVKDCEIYSCQRIVPFTGKNIWKCSCARTCVWSFPKKKLSDYNSVDILGLDSERSLEVYSKDIKVLFKNNEAETLKEKTDQSDSEMVCKKIRLYSDLENMPLLVQPNSDEALSCNLTKMSELSSVIVNGSDEICKKTDNMPLYNEGKYINETLEFYSNSSAASYNCKDSQPDAKILHLTKSYTKTIPKLCNIVESVKPSDLNIPLKKSSETEQTPKDSINTCTEESEKNDSISVSLIETTLNKMSFSLIPVSQELRSDTVNECSSQSSDESLAGDVESFSHSTNSSDDESSSVRNWTVENSEDKCIQTAKHSKTELCDADDSLDDTNSCDSSLMLLESPKNNQPIRSINTSNDWNMNEDDILILDVIQDDPDLFGYSGEQINSPVSSSPIDNSSVFNKKKESIALACKRQKQMPPVSVSKNANKYLESPTKRCLNFANTLPVDIKEDSLTSWNSVVEIDDDFYGDSPESEEHKEHHDLEKECELKAKYNEENAAEDRNRFQNQKHTPETSHFIVRPVLKESPISPDKPLPWFNDYRNYNNNMNTDMVYPDQKKPWAFENTSFYLHSIKPSFLPYGYCKYFFNTFRGCTKERCSFLHIPNQSDEKLCMMLLQKLVAENHINLLRRAVWIFTKYYRQYLPGVHYDPSVLNELLNSLLNQELWRDIFHVLETGTVVKILPSVDMLIKLFKNVASAGLRTAIPSLMDIFCKLVEAGMIIKPEQLNILVNTMNQLHASRNDINILLAVKSRFEEQLSKKNWLCNLDVAVAEIEHCKEKSDWIKLGTLYLNVRTGCENLIDLKKFCNCISEALMKEPKEEKPEIPYCEFADTVYKDPQLNEVDKNLLGRMGISVIYHYHRNQLWQKGKRVLLKLRSLHIHFTVLKGLTGPESRAPRCQVVNTAVEIFLKCGNLENAMWVLKESEWIINTAMWPCDRMDVLNRHNLLCTIVHQTIDKNMFDMCFEALQNLPGLQDPQADMDVSQYSILFNKLLRSGVENKSLGVSSSVADFMVAKKIPIDFLYLRKLITSLGQSCLWFRARTHYKCAVSLGCYPPLEGNLYRKVLHIPSSLSEIEMLLAIEIFMVSNASSIQSPGGSNQTLQIVLKRSEEGKAYCKERYQAAVDKVIQASRLSDPRLMIKHMTVNNLNEEVYVLDHNSSLKWLNENMRWAGKVWLFP